MSYTQEQLEALENHGAAVAALFEFQFTSETKYLWNGIIDRKFSDDNVYQGMFGRLSVPEIPQSRSGDNAQEVISVDGLPAEFVALIDDHLNEVDDNHLYQRQQILHPDTMQPIGPARVKQLYIMRGPVSRLEGGKVTGAAPESTLGIKIETIFGSRAQAGFGRWTTQDQRGRYPDIEDNVFNDVPQIAIGQDLAWP